MHSLNLARGHVTLHGVGCDVGIPLPHPTSTCHFLVLPTICHAATKKWALPYVELSIFSVPVSWQPGPLHWNLLENLCRMP